MLFPNCDGGYYSGKALATTNYSANINLYFLGWYNVVATLLELRKAEWPDGGLNSCTDVVLGGFSAGAVGVFLHLDALRSFLPSRARLAGFASSGFFLATPSYRPKKKFVWDTMNTASTLSQECLAMHVGEEWACLAGAVGANYVQHPVFMVQGRYDPVQLGGGAPAGCASSAACVNAYGANVSGLAAAWLSSKPGCGLFLHSCFGHCTKEFMRASSGDTPLSAFSKWWAQEAKEWKQDASYPCDWCCGGDVAAAEMSSPVPAIPVRVAGTTVLV